VSFASRLHHPERPDRPERRAGTAIRGEPPWSILPIVALLALAVDRQDEDDVDAGEARIWRGNNIDGATGRLGT